MAVVVKRVIRVPVIEIKKVIRFRVTAIKKVISVRVTVSSRRRPPQVRLSGSGAEQGQQVLLLHSHSCGFILNAGAGHEKQQLRRRRRPGGGAGLRAVLVAAVPEAGRRIVRRRT